jgi:hypothetical protein
LELLLVEIIMTKKEEITHWSKSLHELMEAVYIDDEVYSLEDMQVIRNRLDDLIEQESFWTQRENPDKFLTELKNHVSWQANYMEKVFELWELKNA